jgi:hypothetical protein
MVDQLLAMARAEHEESGAAPGAVDLALLARDAVRDFVPRALERQIDLGFEGDASRHGPRIVGNALLLRELIRSGAATASRTPGRAGRALCSRCASASRRARPTSGAAARAKRAACRRRGRSPRSPSC